MSTDRPTGGTRRTKKTSPRKTAAKKTAAKKTTTEKTTTEKTTTGQTADTATAKKKTGKKATGKQRAATTTTASPAPGPDAASRPSGTAPSPAVAPGEPPPGRLDAPDEVMRAAGAIIDIFEHRPDLYLAACAHPVRALRDAGVDLSPSAERWVAHRCRFSPEETEELDRLIEQITRHLGDIDPDDDTAVRRSLRDIGVEVPLGATQSAQAVTAPDAETTPAQVEQLARQRPRPTGPAKQLHPARRSVLLAAEQLPQVRRWREARRPDTDPFEEYEGAHAVMKPLLEYRRRSSTQPRFASDALYERLAASTGGQLASGINIELHVRFTGNGDD